MAIVEKDVYIIYKHNVDFHNNSYATVASFDTKDPNTKKRINLFLPLKLKIKTEVEKTYSLYVVDGYTDKRYVGFDELADATFFDTISQIRGIGVSVGLEILGIYFRFPSDRLQYYENPVEWVKKVNYFDRAFGISPRVKQNIKKFFEDTFV
jgi:hypothetical protein